MISAKIERGRKSYQEDSSHGSLLSNFYYGGFQTKKSKDQKIIRGVAPMIFSGSCEGARMIFFGGRGHGVNTPSRAMGPLEVLCKIVPRNSRLCERFLHIWSIGMVAARDKNLLTERSRPHRMLMDA